MSDKRCPGCYDSFSGPWCDNCDQWPCICSGPPAKGPFDPDAIRERVERESARLATPDAGDEG